MSTKDDREADFFAGFENGGVLKVDVPLFTSEEKATFARRAYRAGLREALDLVNQEESIDAARARIRDALLGGTLTVTRVTKVGAVCSPREPHRPAKTGHKFENGRCRWCNVKVTEVLW